VSIKNNVYPLNRDTSLRFGGSIISKSQRNVFNGLKENENILDTIARMHEIRQKKNPPIKMDSGYQSTLILNNARQSLVSW
jgi:hypothetical protein